MSISLDEAKALVLHAPDVRASVVERGARPSVDVEETGSNGWLLRVYATNGCDPGVAACSTLIGYYDVDKTTTEVDDLDNRRVESPEMSRAREALRRKHCGV